MRMNYGCVIDSVRHAVPLLQRDGCGGSVINFTTIEAHHGAATFSVYAGAKAAKTNFTRAMAVEMGSEKIRFNCIAPYTTFSEGNANAMPAEIAEKMSHLPVEAQQLAFKMYIPATTPSGMEDLANAVLFPASDLSRYVTGTTLHGFGHYYETYRCDDGQWLISRLKLKKLRVVTT